MKIKLLIWLSAVSAVSVVADQTGLPCNPDEDRHCDGFADGLNYDGPEGDGTYHTSSSLVFVVLQAHFDSRACRQSR